MSHFGTAPYLDCSILGGLKELSPNGMKLRLNGDNASYPARSVAKHCSKAEHFGFGGRALAWLIERLSLNRLRIQPMNKMCVIILHKQLIKIFMAEHPDLLRLLVAAPGIYSKEDDARARDHLKLLWQLRQTEIDQLHQASYSDTDNEVDNRTGLASAA